MRSIAERQPNAVAVFADDGEKFGSWPETKKPVFEEGWLRQLFDLLRTNADWIHITTPSETIDNQLPLGNIYIPEGSYREMTEWVLPPAQLVKYEDARLDLQNHSEWAAISRFVHGGAWRNFLVRYPEANEMYSRMMMVSRRLAQIEHERAGHREAATNGTLANGNGSISGDDLLRQAHVELYRGQCNCPYWHGAFGGIYLPHLRNAIYQHLIAAENILDKVAGRHAPWVEAVSDDFNLDGRPDIELANERLVASSLPAVAGKCTNSTCVASVIICWPPLVGGQRRIIAACWPDQAALVAA